MLYTDPNGEFIFTTLAAIFAPPLLPWAIAADIGWIGNVYMNWKDITQNGFDFGKFGSYASVGAATGVATATGNPSLILASGIVSASANEYIAEDYQFTGKVVNSGIQGGITSAVTLGFSNLGLDKVVTNTAQNIGFNKVVSQRIGDFTLNFVGDFTTATTSDAMFNDGNINWWGNFYNASFSAGISLGIDLAISKQSIPADNKNIKNESPSETKSLIKSSEMSKPATPKPVSNQYNNRHTNKGVVPQPPVIKYNQTSKTFNFDPLQNDRMYKYKPKK